MGSAILVAPQRRATSLHGVLNNHLSYTTNNQGGNIYITDRYIKLTKSVPLPPSIKSSSSIPLFPFGKSLSSPSPPSTRTGTNVLH
jgi:hypothetical protein